MGIAYFPTNLDFDHRLKLGQIYNRPITYVSDSNIIGIYIYECLYCGKHSRQIEQCQGCGASNQKIKIKLCP